MEISLAGRAAIVTGGSKGIGFAVAARFAGSGADVAIVARTGEPLKEAVAAIRKSTQTRVIGVQADVSKAADVQRAYDEAMKAFDKVDIVVNNAGTSRAMPFDKLTDELLHDDLELKLFAAVRLIRLVAPQMKERRWGRIINVLNIGAKAPRPNSMPTSISRAAPARSPPRRRSAKAGSISACPRPRSRYSRPSEGCRRWRSPVAHMTRRWASAS